MKKLGGFLLVPMVILGTLALLSAPAAATVVTLDGVANAALPTNLTTYLYVVDKNNPNTVYFKWNYGDGTTLPWTNLPQMATALTAGDYVGTNDWLVESGGNPFSPQPNGVVWQTLTALSAGWYTLRLTSDSQAYNLKSYQWPNETSANLNIWNAYVQIYAQYSGSGSDSFNFGTYGDRKPTEAEALQNYRDYVDGMQIYLANTADVHFYINDLNSVDNAGSVSLEFNPVPLPGSLYLLGPGLAFLLARRFKLRA
jgi:hypothetical protein